MECAVVVSAGRGELPTNRGGAAVQVWPWLRFVPSLATTLTLVPRCLAGQRPSTSSTLRFLCHSNVVERILGVLLGVVCRLQCLGRCSALLAAVVFRGVLRTSMLWVVGVVAS